MDSTDVFLKPLAKEQWDEFICMNQTAFQIAVDEQFGKGAGTAIPRKDILRSLESPVSRSFAVMFGDKMIGGVVCQVNPKSIKASLDLLFLSPEYMGKGLGYKVWLMVEYMFPGVRVWETHTPYFDKRNIHFYINKCGFRIVEFYCPAHPMEDCDNDFPGCDYFFRFEKTIG